MSGLQSIQISSLNWKDFFLKNIPEGAVRRLVIIDAANVLRSSQPQNYGEEKCSLMGLLVMMRFFLKNGFETIAVFSEKYTKKNVLVHDTRKLEKLIELGAFTVSPQNILDDLLCLEIAKTTNGVVISRDQFRDHAYTSQHGYKWLAHIIARNLCGYKVEKTPPGCVGVLTSNGHYVDSSYFSYPRSSTDTFFCLPEDPYFPVSQDYWDNYSTQANNSAELIHIIDEYILEISCTAGVDYTSGC